MRVSVALVAIALATAVPVRAAAQLEVNGRGASLTIGGLVQPQYSYSSIESANNDFQVRRARLGAEVTVNDFVFGRVLTEFGAGPVRVLDAYAGFAFSPGFQASFGKFKRAFDIFELPGPRDLPEIERDGRIPGYTGCAGFAGPCTYSRLTEGLLYAGRDIGARVGGMAGDFSYLATFTNGTGLNIPDENDRKSFSGRATFAVGEDVSVSGQLALHDYLAPDGDANAVAFGGDVEWGTWRDELHVRGSIVAGDNWRALDVVNDAATFLTFQGIVTYYFPYDGDRLEGIEPLARLSFADPDVDTDEDGGLLLTPGLMFYVWDRNRIGANLDIYAPQTGDTELALHVQATLHF